MSDPRSTSTPDDSKTSDPKKPPETAKRTAVTSEPSRKPLRANGRERSFVQPQSKHHSGNASNTSNGRPQLMQRQRSFVRPSEQQTGGNNGDFSQKRINRERSFVRPSAPKQPMDLQTSSKKRMSAHAPLPQPRNLRAPAREIYRPPPASSTNLNPTAKEFSPVVPQSKSHGDILKVIDRRQSAHVKFPPTSQRPPTASTRTPIDLRKSKSLSAADAANLVLPGRTGSGSPDLFEREYPELGSFASDVQLSLSLAVEDPNQLSGRILMDLVKQIFNRVVEGTRYAEPAARFCINIIERELKETFLECLLNTCQEWYQHKDRLLIKPTVMHSSNIGTNSNPRWTAFMQFLSEMYILVKRKQLCLMTKYEGVPPKLVLLTLLGECCIDTLGSKVLASVNEVECLFIVLTSIGRDLEVESPPRMDSLVNGLRDAFLTSDTLPSIRKTLLQLIELQASGWQIPTSAVMYYYPGTGAVM